MHELHRMKFRGKELMPQWNTMRFLAAEPALQHKDLPVSLRL
jgi:hypothetical protein